MDSGRTATFSADKPAHIDHGYAVTSHSAQGATAGKVMVHAESSQSAALVNERFAYVAGSRMRDGLDIYTDNSQRLTASLERQFDKTAAVHDRGTAARQEYGVNGNGKGTTGRTSHDEQQGHSQASSTGQQLGYGR
jgi:ATP-dependent exoDNAse (exonuclease V) alpha subunit